uniref:U16-Eretoxin-Ek1n_1 n=1 Tax=Eresus cinnaberinus TaxID=175337 RepID=A0A2D0PC96_ERECI
MELKAQVMILLVVCIAVAASENYCPEVKGECSLSYRINDCCYPKRLPIICNVLQRPLWLRIVKIHQLPEQRSGY